MKTHHREHTTVYFLGSGPIAVPVLQALLNAAQIRLIGVGTQPDQRCGRGKKTRATAVAQKAASAGLSQVDKPASVNDPAFVKTLAGRRPEMMVVVSFGQILKGTVLDQPRHACLNVHASLLPRHRGAAPIAHTILAGDKRSGVSFMAMDEELDAGPVYRRVAITLNGAETAQQLQDRLGTVAAEHIGSTVRQVAAGELKAVEQDHSAATYAPKLSKADGRIDWQEPAHRIERLVRAYQPWPKAWFMLPTAKGRRRIQVTAAQVVENEDRAAAPGTCVNVTAEGVAVRCGSAVLRLLRVVPEGKREMSAAEFARGDTIKQGTLCC